MKRLGIVPWLTAVLLSPITSATADLIVPDAITVQVVASDDIRTVSHNNVPGTSDISTVSVVDSGAGELTTTTATAGTLGFSSPYVIAPDLLSNLGEVFALGTVSGIASGT